MASTQGKNNKLLQKIYKALKLPKDSKYLKDIVDIAEIKDGVNRLYELHELWFDAYRNSSFPTSGSFTNLTYDSLRGNSGMVDIATGIFNVQVSGDYEFHYQGRDQNNNGKPGEMRLLKNGVTMSQSVLGALFIYGKGGTIQTMFGTAILELQAGDKVWVQTHYNLYGDIYAGIHFTGTMLRMA